MRITIIVRRAYVPSWPCSRPRYLYFDSRFRRLPAIDIPLDAAARFASGDGPFTIDYHHGPSASYRLSRKWNGDNRRRVERGYRHNSDLDARSRSDFGRNPNVATS